MEEIEYYAFTIDITSEISFGDGHTESGESSHFSGEVRSRSAGEDLARVREKLMNEIYKTVPFGGIFRAFRQMINDPHGPSYKARQKLDITFFIHEKATGYKENGETINFENDYEHTKPYF